MLEENPLGIWLIAGEYVLYKLDVDKGLFWLFNIEEGTCLKLNEVSYFMLSCLDGKKTLSTIQDQILARYSTVNKEIVLNDFKELLDTLKGKGIINLVS